jgi:hypothetical protein
LFIADLKANETDIIKILPEINSYGINQKKLIFGEIEDIGSIEVKCIVFTKDELWVFNPEFLRNDIIKFIRYANSLRDSDLKSLPFSKGLKRTNLLDDMQKVVFFLQEFINKGEKNDLDDNKS